MGKGNWSRRQFLQGAGGFLLPLPLLPSLLPRKAWGATPTIDTICSTQYARTTVPKFAFHSEALWNADPRTQKRDIRSAFFKASTANITAPTVFSGSGWSRNRADLALICGLFCAKDKADHHSGDRVYGGTGSGANLASFKASGTVDDMIDQYCADQGIKRPFNMLPINPQAKNYSAQFIDKDKHNVGSHVCDKNGAFRTPYTNAQELWNLVFKDRSGAGTPPQVDPRLKVVDRVLASTKSLQGKLGSADKLVLDAFLSGISSIENRIKSLTPTSTSTGGNCIIPAKPTLTDTTLAEMRDPIVADHLHALIDIAVLAAYCGLTRMIPVTHSAPMNLDWGGQHTNSHGDSGEDGKGDGRKGQIEFISWAINNSFYYMADKMRGLPTADGLSLFDYSNIFFSLESCGTGVLHGLGPEHTGDIDTGMYVAVLGRNGTSGVAGNQVSYVIPCPNYTGGNTTAGIYPNSLWNFILQSMGVPKSYYEAKSGMGPGFGNYQTVAGESWGFGSSFAAEAIRQAVSLAGEIPPGFKILG